MSSSAPGPIVVRRRAYGSGTIEEVRPGVFRLRVFDGTRQVSRTVRADGKVEVSKQLAKFVRDIAERTDGGSTTLVSQLLAEFIEHSRARGRSPKTIYEAERTAERIINPELGSISLNKLTTRRLDQFYVKLLDAGHGPSSVRRYHAVLSAALSQAVRWQWLPHNPAADVTLTTAPRADLHAITVEDVRRLIAAAESVNPRFAMLMKLGVLTGARRGELCALRWNDVDLDEGFVRIRAALYRAGAERGEKLPKSGRITEVPLDEFGVNLLRDWRLAHPVLNDECFLVSSTPDGSKPVNPDSLSSFVYREAKKLGLKLEGRNPLRHLAGTELIAQGMDVRSVADHLGHSDPTVTLRRYAHGRVERKREGAAVLAGILQPDHAPTSVEAPPA